MADIIVKKKPGRPRTKPDTPENNRIRERDRIRKARDYERNMEYVIEMLGGECAATGSTEHLEIHHLRPSKKGFTFGDGHHRSKAELDAEMTGCVLLCAKVHREIHNKVNASMADFDNKTGWSSESARNSVKDWVCERVTRLVIIKHQIINALENI